MPITAALADGSRVKARMWAPDEFREMVGSKARPDFWCPFCEAPMHPKTRSQTGLQFFAHNPGGPDCRFNVGNGESGMHLQLKDYITAAIDNVSGWEGMPEHRVEVDGKHYVADVYATRTNGKTDRPPGVFEVQLSRQGDGEVIERQTIRNASGAVTTWLTRTPSPWFRRVPTLQIDTTDSGRVQIVDGLMATDTDKAEPTLLERFIGRRLAGHYAFVENVGIIQRGRWVAPAERAPRPTLAVGSGTGGSADCTRTPVPSGAPRPRSTSQRLDTWTMNIRPERTAIDGEEQCKWLGCPAPAERRLAFPSGADWMPHACVLHADALAERYGASVTVLA